MWGVRGKYTRQVWGSIPGSGGSEHAPTRRGGKESHDIKLTSCTRIKTKCIINADENVMLKTFRKKYVKKILWDLGLSEDFSDTTHQKHIP